MFSTLLTCLLSTVSFAQLESRLDLYGSYSFRQWNQKSSFNSDNRQLQIPQDSFQLELRPDFQYSLSPDHFLILRSQHFLQNYTYDFKNPASQSSETLSESDLSDFYLSSQWNSQLQTGIGLQNYQWGPAEIYSPTNPFFHFLGDQRSFFFKEKGRILLRVNWSSADTAKYSVIGIYEPINNQTRYWTADKNFKPKSLIKIEYHFENPAHQLAFVGGTAENDTTMIGEYFTWSFQEGQSVYADIKHQKGRTNYVPQSNGFGSFDLVSSDGNEKIFTTAVTGYRWEGRVDFRQEFIFNESGFNDKEWLQAKSSVLVLSPQILTNARRFAKPGLEFLTQTYSYTSIRIPDLGPDNQSSVSFRWLSSLRYHSGVLQINVDHNLNDHTVITAESLHYQGSNNQEFRLAETQQTSLGFRYSF